MLKKILITIILIGTCLKLSSQSINIKIIDSLSEQPIPYVNIYFTNKNGLISDEFGNFQLIKSQLSFKDSIYISLMGYNKKAFLVNDFNDSIVKLTQTPIKLSDVFITNRELSSEEIISKVRENIDKNYEIGFSKNKIYLSRKANVVTEKFVIDKFKSTVPDINKSLLDSVLSNLSKENKSELQILSYYYGSYDGDNQKIKMIKARETYDKGGEVLQSLNKKMREAFKKELKPDSYFKIKSGIFGRDLEFDGLEEVDSTNVESIKKFEEKELKEKDDFANRQKSRIKNIYKFLFFVEKSPLNFILKPNKYIFSEPRINNLGNDLVYVIECSPKGRNKYSATLFINPYDFAVVRLDFKNIKPLFNIKLLGVFQNVYLREGKILLSKYENKKYNLSYLKINYGQKTGFDRPIKLIEKNKNVKGRRKQNEISFRMDLKIDRKIITELQVFESSEISKDTFQTIDDKNDVYPEYLEKFTTNFWEEF
tara:strand:- start:110 stop:1555 length:1446 start_codon:yes stop_codon:yes gene_type:complete